MKITTYKYIKVPVNDVEINIPHERFYCFQTGIRRSICINPVFLKDYSTEEPYELEVICVYKNFEKRVEKFNIRTSEIEQYLNHNENNEKTMICDMLLSKDYYKRTEEQFKSDLKSVIDTFKI